MADEEWDPENDQEDDEFEDELMDLYPPEDNFEGDEPIHPGADASIRQKLQHVVNTSLWNRANHGFLSFTVPAQKGNTNRKNPRENLESGGESSFQSQ